MQLKVCFITGTRAEFGLIRTTLAAIRAHPKLHLQIIATGMHLDRSRGNTIESIRKEGWTIDRVVPWKSKPGASGAPLARATALASAGVAEALDELQSDVVLVVGDRVEAFAGAAAGALSGRIVAHIHGGDRAAGQVDDSLRHTITKLSHVHFPATASSARRIQRLGEDAWRIHMVGAPGIDGIRRLAASRRELTAALGTRAFGRFALLVLHPVDADPAVEQARASIIAKAVRAAGFPQIVLVDPNNDPGAAGITRAWDELHSDPIFLRRPNIARPLFVGLMKEAAVLIGNSSSGIIEAASFGTPVIDIGPRQQGREHGPNVRHVAYQPTAIRRALAQTWSNGRAKRYPSINPYGGQGTGKRIATVLAGLRPTPRLLRKLIAY
jgi:UDP-hydrolysing UDP-N-acetyl-D-glucosamine 2-epimerase